MTSLKMKENPCKNFSPNIFNKNKCQNCFKPRDTHMHLDKDLTKAKPIYYGWLLLAPIGTDFTNPMHKNRKWQRRWFVLFEHGALRYSLDENVSTVPQGTIDMNQSTDVIYADSIVEQKYTLCIFTSEQSIYMKGENREDVMGWRDVLLPFPEMAKEEAKRKKRLQNRRAVPAREPSEQAKPNEERNREGSRSTSSSSPVKTPPNHPAIPSTSSRTRHHVPVNRTTSHPAQSTAAKTRAVSVITDVLAADAARPTSASSSSSKDVKVVAAATADIRSPVELSRHSSTSSLDSASSHSVAGSESTDTGGFYNFGVKKRKPETGGKVHGSSSRQKRESRKEVEKRSQSPGREEMERLMGRERRRSRILDSLQPSTQQADQSNKENNKPAVAGGDVSSSTTSPSSMSSPPQTPGREGERQSRGRTISRRSTQTKQGTQTDATSQPPTPASLRRAKSLDRRAYESVTLSADIFNMKKGLLTKLADDDNTWHKHWFVLNDKSLRYYKDSTAEDSAQVDGTIDLMTCTSVVEVDVQRNYGFEIKTTDVTYKMAAMTSGIRRSWIDAIKRATSAIASGKSDDVIVSTTVTSPADLPTSPIDVSNASEADYDELNVTERSLRRRQRIRERRKEGRARTFDFSEIRQSEKFDRDPGNNKQQLPATVDSKTRSRNGGLLKDVQNNADNSSSSTLHRQLSTDSPAASVVKKSSAEVRRTIESEWGKIESAIPALPQLTYPPAQSNPLTQTAHMVKVLQTEIDSLKKQMDRARSISNNPPYHLLDGDDSEAEKHVTTRDGDVINPHDATGNIVTQEAERDMQLEISRSESQLANQQVITLRKQLALQERKREDERHEHIREMATMKSRIEQVEDERKKLVDLHHDYQQAHEASASVMRDQVVMLNERIGELQTRADQEESERRKQRVEDERAIREYEEKIREMEKVLNGDSDQRNDTTSPPPDDVIGDDDVVAELRGQIASLTRSTKMAEDRLQTSEVELANERRTSAELNAKFAEHRDLAERRDVEWKEMSSAFKQMKAELRCANEANISLRAACQDASSHAAKEMAKMKHSSDQTIRELRARLAAADRQLVDIEQIRQKHSEPRESSFKTKLSELEAEMDGTGQMIAARLSALEKPRHGSEPSLSIDSAASKRAEVELQDKSRRLRDAQERIAQLEQQHNDKSTTSHSSNNDDRLRLTQQCLARLHARATRLLADQPSIPACPLLESVLRDTLRASTGHLDHDVTGQWSTSRLRQLSEDLGSDHAWIGGQQSCPVMNKDKAAAVFAKQISTQAMMLAEMALAIRRNQPSPSLVAAAQRNAQQQRSGPPQLASADFCDSRARQATGATTEGHLVQHGADALAQKMTLEGLLMREVARLRAVWSRGKLTSGRGGAGQQQGGGQQQELSCAMAAHAHISYVLQVYNERISRLSLEARQARHRANVFMRKLRELVDACKTQDLETVSQLAVQVDTDSIAASPYSDLPLWEQQVDYGTLHGAEACSSRAEDEATYLDESANFFRQLADDLTCASVDVESIARLGSQLVICDHTLLRLLDPGEVGEKTALIAREAIVQAEILYISYRLRRDYDEELMKAKRAVSEQATHHEKLECKLKQVEEVCASKLKHITEEHNAKVGRLMQEAGRLEHARSEMSKDMEERLTRLSRKHQQELAACTSKHDQETVSLRRELSTANKLVQVKTQEYMGEVKALTQRLEQIGNERRSEAEQMRIEYETMLEKAKEDWRHDVTEAEQDHFEELKELKVKFETELAKNRESNEEQIRKKEVEWRNHVIKIEEDHRDQIVQLEKEHGEEVESSVRATTEQLTSHFDQRLREDTLRRQEALESVRADAERVLRDHLTKEKEVALSRQEQLHQFQMEREKTAWLEELRQKWEEEQRAKEVTAQHTESKEMLRARINTLEHQIDSMKDVEGEAGSYQQQLDDLKHSCDESFAAIESIHAKQLEELSCEHARELERMREEQEKEMEMDREDTRRAIDAMRQHHAEELQLARAQVTATSSDSTQHLEREIEKLSSHYSRKCVELADAVERNDRAEDALCAVERDNQRLQGRVNELCRSLQEEMSKSTPDTSSVNSTNHKQAGDIYQLQVKLRVKSSELEYRGQEIESLNKQLAQSFQEKKSAQRKHQKLFDEVTLARAKENASRRELALCRDELRRVTADDVTVTSSGATPSSSVKRNRGSSVYDFRKSPSQPDLPNNPTARQSADVTTTSMTSSPIKRRSSERTPSRRSNC